MMKIQKQKEDVFTRMFQNPRYHDATCPTQNEDVFVSMLLIVKFQIHPVMNFIVHQLNVISE